MTARAKWCRLTRWVCLAASLLLTITLIASGWWTVSWRGTPGPAIGISRGALVYYSENDTDLRGFLLGSRSDPEWNWIFNAMHDTPIRHWWVYVPLWPAVVVLLLVVGATWVLDLRRGHRFRAGLCPSCGYDRRGLATDALCPECAKPAILPRS